MAINFDGKGNIESTTKDGAIAVKLYSLEKQIEEKDKKIERLNNTINNAMDFIETEVGIMAIDTDNYMSCDELTKCGIGCLWKILKEGNDNG